MRNGASCYAMHRSQRIGKRCICFGGVQYVASINARDQRQSGCVAIARHHTDVIGAQIFTVSSWPYLWWKVVAVARGHWTRRICDRRWRCSVNPERDDGGDYCDYCREAHDYRADDASAIADAVADLLRVRHAHTRRAPDTLGTRIRLAGHEHSRVLTAGTSHTRGIQREHRHRA